MLNVDEDKSKYIKLNFSYKIRLKRIKSKDYIQMSVYYHGEEIFFSTISPNIITDYLFINICKEYKKNYL